MVEDDTAGFDCLIAGFALLASQQIIILDSYDDNVDGRYEMTIGTNRSNRNQSEL